MKPTCPTCTALLAAYAPLERQAVAVVLAGYSKRSRISKVAFANAMIAFRALSNHMNSHVTGSYTQDELVVE